jgi:sortase (surface protein transpeptidase)
MAGPQARAPARHRHRPAPPASAGQPPALRYTRPVRVSIPAIGVRARVIPLGENPDGTVAVPPLSEPSVVSWFDKGPAPGQPGPATLLGHVDVAATGPAVFYRLATLTPGDTVNITRASHQVAMFRVYRIARSTKNAFPTRTVFGPTSGAQLRLITCGGPFNPATGSYPDNIVAFAQLTGVRSPRLRPAS